MLVPSAHKCSCVKVNMNIMYVSVFVFQRSIKNGSRKSPIVSLRNNISYISNRGNSTENK